MSGVRWNTLATSSSVKRIPASWRWRAGEAGVGRAAVAATAAQAFSRLLAGTRSRGSGPPSARDAQAVSLARGPGARRSEYTGGSMAVRGKGQGEVSATIANGVGGENWPGQERRVAHKSRSISASWSSVIAPAITAPTLVGGHRAHRSGLPLPGSMATTVHEDDRGS